MPNPPLKLAFSTLGCPGWSLRQAVDACRDMGYDAIEVRGIGSELRSERIPDFLPHNRRATREMLRADGYRGYLSFEWEKRWIADLAEPEIALPLFVRHGRALERG